MPWPAAGRAGPRAAGSWVVLCRGPAGAVRRARWARAGDARPRRCSSPAVEALAGLVRDGRVRAAGGRARRRRAARRHRRRAAAGRARLPAGAAAGGAACLRATRWCSPLGGSRPLVAQVVNAGPLAGDRIVGGRGPRQAPAGPRTTTALLHVHLGMHGSVRLAPRRAPAAAGTCCARPAATRSSGPRACAFRPSHGCAWHLAPTYLATSTRPSSCAAPGWSTGRSASCCSTSASCAGDRQHRRSAEALWECRADPFAPVSSLPDAAPARAGRRGRGAMLRRRGRAARPPAARVYRRAGRPCPRCATAIRSRAAGRAAADDVLVPGVPVAEAKGRRGSVADRARGVMLGLAVGDALGARCRVAAARADHGPLRRSAARPGAPSLRGSWASGPTTPPWRSSWRRAWPTAAATTRTTCSPATWCGRASAPQGHRRHASPRR